MPGQARFVFVVELIPESFVAPIDLEKTFGRVAPLRVDLGCGDGAFLCALAQHIPEENFLGTERLLGRIRSAARKAATLGNVRLLHVESSYAVRHLLPSESVETFYLLFPDPWPKKRHHRRRIVTWDFLNSVHTALGQNGILRIATDQLDYFEQIMRLARSHSGFVLVDVDNLDLPSTKFERKFRAQGVPIHQLELRKVSPVR